MRNKSTILIILVIVIAIGVLAYVFFESEKSIKIEESSKPKIITENLIIPNTQSITGLEGKMMSGQNAPQIPLVPKTESEMVIVPKAELTIKGSYNLVLSQVIAQASDAKLVFIKSLGAITLDGKSSQWQFAFHSLNKNKGYEIIVRGDQIISQKEIESTATGMDTPQKWFDSDEAIKTLQDMPQYSNASVSAINFFYNTDANEWKYGVSTSAGVTSIRLRQ